MAKVTIQSMDGHFVNLPLKIGDSQKWIDAGTPEKQRLDEKACWKSENALQEAHFSLKDYETVISIYIRISALVVTIYTNTLSEMKLA